MGPRILLFVAFSMIAAVQLAAIRRDWAARDTPGPQTFFHTLWRRPAMLVLRVIVVAAGNLLLAYALEKAFTGRG